MRKLLSFAGMVLLGSVVGCQSCGTSACGSGCGGCGGSGSRCGDHRALTTGVCDCDLPPLAPYGRAAVAPPLAPAAVAVAQNAQNQTAAQPTSIQREMPPAADGPSK